ncbi:MAG TPA: DUF1501 domain-containing protein [Bryobacteraceae bacterium]|nr:DUF1501 domain-containing protein [Bryobacteraceae bacterium]
MIRVDRTVSRRELLAMSGLGFGAIAAATLLQAETTPNHTDLQPRPGHFAASAKAVIQMVQNGGPSQMDLFDPKPELTKRGGQPHPDGVEIHQPDNQNILLPSSFEFSKHGQSGMELSEILPHLSTIADDICLIRSMHTEHNNHPEALHMLLTCKIFPGRPVVGSWITYALGSVSQNLPAYVVLRDPAGYSVGARLLWSSGWLPALYQGVEFSSSGTPVHHLKPSRPLPPTAQRRNLDLLNGLNKIHSQNHPGETELDARIQNFELAARMQLAAMDALDLSKEPESVRKLYGLDNPITAPYGTRCLMARRLVEAGVRFVQIFVGKGQPWDHHANLKHDLQQLCAKTDQPSAALVKDLKSRGLLDSTVVMWAGEFGRLPTTQNADGRDHNRNAFSLWLAGGGFKPGLVHGATDHFGYKATIDRVSVPNLQATLLHTLGLDHSRLTYPHGGRLETPTEVSITGASVVRELLKNPSI